MAKSNKFKTTNFKFPKAETGIQGFDVITEGGLPRNRPTLLLGNTGCGKTIMAMEFLVNGITMFDEPGVFMSFEEKTDELKLNVKSLGYDLSAHIAQDKMYIEQVQVNNENHETGTYSIEGLFVRLERAIDKVKAKRVVLDSLETLLYGLDKQVLRTEFKRLFFWLKEKKVTAIITVEIGDSFLSRQGVAEYVADCVIVLDNRVVNQITTRRLRVIKYRGSIHGNNEYPFTIDQEGITVLPLISEGLQQKISGKIISSGIKELDEMLGKKGFFVGSSILISGTGGSGKTSIVSSFVFDVCTKKQRCLFCAFEEAPNQIIRNMGSIGLSLKPFMKNGMLDFYYSRPTLQNLELHFIAIKKMISEIKPKVVILDPITNLMTEGPNSDIRSMLTKFVDYLKTEQITVMFTAAITLGSIERNPSDEGISTMVDTWLMVQDTEKDEERNRSIYVMKSRGMIHSKSVREFIISADGIKIIPIVRSGKDVLVGSERIAEKTGGLSLAESHKLVESGRNGHSKKK